MSVSSIQSNIEKTLENIFSMTKKILIRNTILLISFVILFVLFPSIYYLYTFKLFNIVHDYPILSIFLTLLTFFSCLVIILLKFEKSVDINILYKILYNLMYVGAIFLLFSLLFHVSKFFVYSSNSTSIYLSFILLTLFLSLRNSFERESFDDDILDMKDDLFADLKALKEEGRRHTTMLLLTDIMTEGSQLLVVSDDSSLVESAFDVKLENSQVWLPKVLSRKKQVVPFLEPVLG